MVDSLVWGNPNGATTRSLLLYLFARVKGIGWGAGDSGAPVFASHNTACGLSVYCALGLESAGEGATWGPTNTTDQSLWGICKAGPACNIIFSRWDNIEADLSLGTLNPRT